MSWEEAEKYRVYDIRVRVDDKGEQYVVVEVQGIRADGSYWVNGFSFEVPYDQYFRLSDREFDDLVRQKIAENEEQLRKWRQAQRMSEQKTLETKHVLGNRVGREYYASFAKVT